MVNKRVGGQKNLKLGPLMLTDCLCILLCLLMYLKSIFEYSESSTENRGICPSDSAWHSYPN